MKAQATPWWMRRLQGVMFPSILDFLSTKESFVWEIVHPHFRRCLAVIVSDGALSNHFYFAPAGGLCIVCRQPTTTTTTTTTTNNKQQRQKQQQQQQQQQHQEQGGLGTTIFYTYVFSLLLICGCVLWSTKNKVLGEGTFPRQRT